jgi:exodeoxyribonuclease V alpha subunit
MAYRERIEGELQGFSFQAEDGGYAVARLKPEAGASITVVGPIGHLPVGSFLRLEGQWSEHARYGKQFRVRSYLVEDPKTLKGLERYLASGSVRGLGAGLSKRVVEHFGLDTLRVLDEEPDRLREVNGIGKKRVEEVVAFWEKDKADRELAVAMRGYGLGAAVTRRILDKYGNDSLAVLNRDPYALAGRIRGIAFRSADQIAKAMGIQHSDPRRANAAVRWLLQSASGSGHCYLPLGVLIRKAAEVSLAEQPVRDAINRLVLKAEIVFKRHARPMESIVALAEMSKMEAEVARRVTSKGGGKHLDESWVRNAADQVGLKLNAEQQTAVGMANGQGICVITGGPGTGKTTIVKVLMRLVSMRKEKWILGAPTGRAAKRLSESCGHEAKTIHRILEFKPGTQGFARDASNTLKADGILIDEASMVDLPLFAALLAATPPGCRLVLVGDADQLPSVGPGQVLRDLIDSEQVPIAALKMVYRQAEDSSIVRNAHRVLQGELPISSEKEGTKKDFFLLSRDQPEVVLDTLVEVVTQRLPSRGFDAMDDVQVLTPMHKGTLGSENLNRRLQAALNPTGPSLERGNRLYRRGDRVLQQRNDYDKEVFNGDVGRIVGIEDGTITVQFGGKRVGYVGEELDDLVLAYAISIHKSQGSEYPAVVTVLHTGHFIMLRRNLLYTAMTRAKSFCVIVGAYAALRPAVDRVEGGDRYTTLADRIRGEADESR